MSYLGQNINVANSAPRASETQVGLTPYATTVETFFGVEAGKAVTPFGLSAALNLYGVMEADRRQATAWVNFNGTGTVAIRDAYNVSSITDNGAGDYTVNFAIPMNNANYSAVGNYNGANTNSGGNNDGQASCFNYTSNGVSVVTPRGNGEKIDSAIVCVHVFGGRT